VLQDKKRKSQLELQVHSQYEPKPAKYSLKNSQATCEGLKVFERGQQLFTKMIEILIYAMFEIL
jgi:hypothetical protein